MKAIAPGVEVFESFVVDEPKGIGFVSHAYGMSDDSRHRIKLLHEQGYNVVGFKREDQIITEETGALSRAVEAMKAEISATLKKHPGGQNVISAASLGGVMIGAAAARIGSETGSSPVDFIVHDSPLLNGRERCHDYFIELKKDWSFDDSNVNYLADIRADYEQLVRMTSTRFLLEIDDPHDQIRILESLQQANPDQVEIQRVDLPGKRHGFLVRKVREAITEAIATQQK